MASPTRKQNDELDPFNHYNTEFVKLDANNWQDHEDGTKLIHLDGLEFGLLEPNECGQIYEKLAFDSVNVNVSIIIIIITKLFHQIKLNDSLSNKPTFSLFILLYKNRTNHSRM